MTIFDLMGDTRNRLIQKTASFLTKKGYFGTGIREILQETGIPKGSLYHHFPMGKVELAKEALIFNGKIMNQKFIEAMQGKSATEALKGIVNVLQNELIESKFSYGCPLATVTLEVSGEEEDLQSVCGEMYQNWENALTEFLTRRGDPNPRKSAKFFLIALEGAFVLSKATRDASYMELVKDQITNIIKSN